MKTQQITEFTILFVAPFYNRSGYGTGARSLARRWTQAGVPVRILPVDQEEPGIDDFDLNWLRSLEKTAVRGRLIAVFYHVPSQAWLDLSLPAGSCRVMLTTFDGSLQGAAPPADWIRICNHMDLVFLNEREIPTWIAAGLNQKNARKLDVPHIWLDNNFLPSPHLGKLDERFRFLTIAMFQPRRRWDTLFAAFAQEFADQPSVELNVKVNYPSWHPVPGGPRQDLLQLIEATSKAYPSKARIVIDDSLGTRGSICRLIDESNCYVSTDTAPCAPVDEALIRSRPVIVPATHAHFYPANACTLIEEDPDFKKEIDQDILNYQPHHKGHDMPLLRMQHVRTALRMAFMNEGIRNHKPWQGWEEYLLERRNPSVRSTTYFLSQIVDLLQKWQPDARPQVRWEGSQFVYHSLAHVNRQLCQRIEESTEVKLSILPYEADEFDPAVEMPRIAGLIKLVNRPLERANVHVRHQWPPNFSPPPEGAWVMIQPWEFGGIPAEWIKPMRDLVDEIWVPSNWVRDCYIQSGIPADKVQVIPNGVDPEIFANKGTRYPLPTKKRFRFLFLGGTIHRKGIDIVLDAYLNAFTASDDVCLVIKGQPGNTYQGSELDLLLERIRAENPNSPEIFYMTNPLTEDEVASLYRSCNVLLHPYRGEGFGLPIAEAMSCGLSIIVTGRGAANDFVRPDFAYLIPSKKLSTRVGRHKPSAPDFWLEEPNIHEVIRAMKSAFSDPHQTEIMGQKARNFAEENLSWDAPTKKILERIGYLAKTTPQRFFSKKTAFVYRAQWNNDDWKEIVISYISEFKPEEPVTLILPVSDECEFSSEQVIQKITSLLLGAGIELTPDIVVSDSVSEILQLIKTCETYWIDETPGSVLGLDGENGIRFGRARLLYQRSRIAT